MSKHSVVEAKNQLSNLIDRALEGEEVVITRHGQPMVRLAPIAKAGRRMTVADIEWLRSVRVTPEKPDDNPVSIVERMRNEDHERLLRR
jgi:prevent-host-death family protein